MSVFTKIIIVTGMIAVLLAGLGSANAESIAQLKEQCDADNAAACFDLGVSYDVNFPGMIALNWSPRLRRD